MKRSFVPALLLIILPLCLSAQDAKPVLAVLDFKTNNISESDMKSIISLLSSALFRTGEFTVIDVTQRDTILKELEFSTSDCTDESCQLEIGKLLSASMIVVGDIGKVGSRYIISSKMLETETARTLNTADGIYINLDSLIDDIYSFTEKLSGITEQVPEEIVEKKPPELPEEKEMAPGEEQEKLLGEKAEPQKVEHYLTVGAGFGLTFPIGAAADVLGFAYNPLASINYNSSFSWGAIGFGLTAGTNITFTNSDAAVQYGLYSIPVAVSITYRTNFKLPLFFIIDVNPGIDFTILN